MFDGAARGNPGPVGAGAVLYACSLQGFREKIWEGWDYVDQETTCNVAEYRGVLLGLCEVVRHYTGMGMLVEGDSALVINQLLGSLATRRSILQQCRQASLRLMWVFCSLLLLHIWMFVSRMYGRDLRCLQYTRIFKCMMPVGAAFPH